MSIKEQIENAPLKKANQAIQYIRQWAYDCAWWERYAIAEFGTRGEKCKASRRLTRICHSSIQEIRIAN